MLVIPPTPLLTIPPRRRLLPLPLQPPHQFPQEALIPAVRMSLNERVRLLPSPDHEHNPSPPPPPATTKTKTKTSSRKGLPLTKRTNQPPTPSTPPSPPPPPHSDLVSSGVGTLFVSSALHPISSTMLFFSAVTPRKPASFHSLISLK